jgi:RNAse (barnase) inhibitor barstar
MSVILRGSNYHQKRFDLTDEHKLETYKARKYEATFEKVNLVVRFVPGHDGKNAISRAFVDAIKLHDEAVKEIEEKWVHIDQLKRDLTKKTRLYRNLDAAWNTLNQNPDDFAEYLTLLPRMRNIRERMKLMKNLKARARAETELKRFEELRPMCLKLLTVHKELNSTKEIRDIAQKAVTEAQSYFDKLRAHEKELSELITDDHIIADERKISLAEYFPNVHMGYVLHSLNGFNLSQMTFEEVIAYVNKVRPPHKVDFRRYDYRFDPIENVWHTLPEVRELGTHVEDPMLTVSWLSPRRVLESMYSIIIVLAIYVVVNVCASSLDRGHGHAKEIDLPR